ncbi:MAG: tetratricopeptide repeat-containing protein [Rhodobacteraceae bacterium]|nr:tetratricopeptide repeat-containing protein [Paracoccaceae bacterium]
MTGLAALARIAFAQGDLRPEAARRIARLEADPQDAAALVDLATILQAQGLAEPARALLAEAMEITRDYTVVHGDGSGPQVLALVTPGDFMANTPLDFLLEGSDAVLRLHYVDAETDSLDALPPHDAAMLAIGEAPPHRAVLERLAPLLARYPRPVLNGAPARIARLTRDGVAALLADAPGLLCPPTIQADRAALERLASGTTPETLHPGLHWPLILRPVGTHAGAGMERVFDAAHLADILADTAAAAFYLTRFIDYRGPHGLYAKARVVLVEGRPYPVHLALSEDWIVHYLSAGMAASAVKRHAEADWMARFDTDFAARHAAAFAALADRVGLDYFGLDCAEAPDGRLLVFEVDVALIVHDMDDPRVFPYKGPAMRRLAAAVQTMLARNACPQPAS